MYYLEIKHISFLFDLRLWFLNKRSEFQKVWFVILSVFKFIPKGSNPKVCIMYWNENPIV